MSNLCYANVTSVSPLIVFFNITMCINSLDLKPTHVLDIPIVGNYSENDVFTIEADLYSQMTKRLLGYIPWYLILKDGFVFSHSLLPFISYMITHNFALSMNMHIFFEWFELHYQQWTSSIFEDEIEGGIIADLICGFLGTLLANRIVLYYDLAQISYGPKYKWKGFKRGAAVFAVFWGFSYGCALIYTSVLNNRIIEARNYSLFTVAITVIAMYISKMILTTHAAVESIWDGNAGRADRDLIIWAIAVSWFCFLLVASALFFLLDYSFVFINSGLLLSCIIIHILILNHLDHWT